MKPFIIFAILVAALSFSFLPGRAQASPVVQIIFFFNPECDNCQQVMTNDLPPLQVKYGSQLEILQIDTSKPEGVQLYQSMSKHFQLTDDRLGTPAIVIGEIILVGADEIPASLPGLIEENLTNGGISWPDIPGLAVFSSRFSQTNLTPGSQVYPQPSGQVSGSTSSGDNTAWERFGLNFKKDTVANSLAVIVLVGMILSVCIVVAILVRSVLAENPSPSSFTIRPWLFLALIVVGLGVAGYLTYIELGQKPALCGPVGNCNEVQRSSYAKLFGILPIGVIGLTGYASLLVAWGVYKLGPQTLHMLSVLALWGMSFFGVAFSIYLTFLEPFVIGATCMWCLSSALLMTALLWITTPILQESLKVEDLGDEDQVEFAE